MKGLNIIVLVKQVPDTRNVGKDAMKANGTVNRSALPAIFNPEDLLALEQALRLKEKNPDSVVTAITMGPIRAANILRDSLFRGADKGILITDKKFAGSDTLATSYVLSLALKKIGDYDVILAGRQAIDGDTAQVGPQVAEKLNLPQITYVEEILEVKKNSLTARRRLENGVETLKGKLPMLLTVHGSAPTCRTQHAKRLMKFKHACTPSEMSNEREDYIQMHETRHYLDLIEWNVDDLKAEEVYLGLSGSPTKVNAVTNIVFTAKESRVLEPTDQDIDSLMAELVEHHNVG
ncbi:MAG: electron transfer flavoprotein subunit beta/FixA family protein [Bacteroidota bacterium]